MEHWSSPNGCHHDCPACEAERGATRKKFIETARNIHQDCDVEIDDDAKLSRVDNGDHGNWVAAWVWVSDEDTKGD